MGTKITVVIEDDAFEILQQFTTSPRKQGEIVTEALRLYKTRAGTDWSDLTDEVMMRMAKLDVQMIGRQARKAFDAAQGLIAVLQPLIEVADEVQDTAQQ